MVEAIYFRIPFNAFSPFTHTDFIGELNMIAFAKKSIALSVVAAFTLQVTACGTIIHPERKGQIDGKLDTSIVALDAIGLLFFIIPGVIAFAVDFSNGTIYLPDSASTETDSTADGMVAFNVDGEVTNEKIEQVILKQTGQQVNLDDDNVVSSNKHFNFSTLEKEVRFL
ncbi:hypothetical protein N9R79_08670 [Vibrio sp.]|nr:hypothetical protein [Vibrio sp.]